MRNSTLRSAVLFTLTLLASATVSPTSATAQTYGWSQFGVGYAASAPNLMAGVDGYVLFPSLHGFGIYVDSKWDIDSPGNDPYFLPNMTRQQAENQVTGAYFIQQKDSWRGIINVAVVKPVTPALMLYLGGGYSERQAFYNYKDPAEELGQLGLFWVQAPEATSHSVSLMLGAFLRLSPYIAFQTGFETRPGGFSIGMTLKFPPR